jgi:Flp pilus assembly protein TadG
MKLSARFQGKLGLQQQRHVLKPHRKRNFKNVSERGSTAVEFAVILPLFLILIFSLIDFGRYFYTRVVITNASIEVASAITRGLYVEGDSVASKNQRILGVLDNVAPNLASFAQLQSGVTLNIPTPLACPNALGAVTVNISTPFTSISPLAPLFDQVASQSTMRCFR